MSETLAAAAKYMDDHLWTRSALTLRDRRRLIAHAVARSAPSPGIAGAIVLVFQHTDACPAWHDAVGITTDELAVVLRETSISAGRFGAALEMAGRRFVGQGS